MPTTRKNPAAVALGRRGGRAGTGAAKARTPEQASAAARARWAKPPATHDYTKRGWGHDYTITDVRKDGMEITMTGWGCRIFPGDYMLIATQSTDPRANPDTRYKVKAIRYSTNPSDMWTMEAVFAPR